MISSPAPSYHGYRFPLSEPTAGCPGSKVLIRDDPGLSGILGIHLTQVTPTSKFSVSERGGLPSNARGVRGPIRHRRSLPGLSREAALGRRGLSVHAAGTPAPGPVRTVLWQCASCGHQRTLARDPKRCNRIPRRCRLPRGQDPTRSNWSQFAKRNVPKPRVPQERRPQEAEEERLVPPRHTPRLSESRTSA